MSDVAPALSVVRQRQSMTSFFNKEPDHAAPPISTRPLALCASGRPDAVAAGLTPIHDAILSPSVRGTRHPDWL